jgi:hypothetical protein
MPIRILKPAAMPLTVTQVDSGDQYRSDSWGIMQFSTFPATQRAACHAAAPTSAALAAGRRLTILVIA